MKRIKKLAEERSKKRAAKAAAMEKPGHKSKYAKRMSERSHGVPMSARPIMPWWHTFVMADFNRRDAEARAKVDSATLVTPGKFDASERSRAAA